MPTLNQLHTSIRRPGKLENNARKKDNVNVLNPNTGTPYVNDTLSGRFIPKGVLAGSVSCIDRTSGEYRECREANDIATGLFGIDAAGDSYEQNIPAESGTITIVSGGYHKVEIYETVSFADNSTPLVYAAGDELYVSPFGFLTKELGLATNDSRPVALVEEAPSEFDSAMTIKLYSFTPTGGLSGGPFEPLDPTILRQSDVVDNLTSTDATAPLSANMGRELSTLLSSSSVKTKAILLTPALITQGYVDLGYTPADRAQVQFYIKSGVPQLNYFIEGYDKATMGIADFAMGDRDTNANPSRIYLRSDIVEGGYATDELVDGAANPGGLPADNSILMVVFV